MTVQCWFWLAYSLEMTRFSTNLERGCFRVPTEITAVFVYNSHGLFRFARRTRKPRRWDTFLQWFFWAAPNDLAIFCVAWKSSLDCLKCLVWIELESCPVVSTSLYTSVETVVSHNSLRELWCFVWTGHHSARFLVSARQKAKEQIETSWVKGIITDVSIGLSEVWHSGTS